MTFQINDIISALNGANGLLMPGHFAVNISTPNWVTQGSTTSTSGTGNTSGVISLIPFVCDSTFLPGISFQTTDIRSQGIGVIERRPTNADFEPISLTFYCDGNGTVQSFFEQWVQNIYNFNINAGDSNSLNGLKMFEMQYPEQYESTIDIYHYDRTSQQILHYQLLRAFPMSKPSIPISWEMDSDILKITVTFSYKIWTSDAIQVGTQSDVYSSFSSSFQSDILSVNPITSLAYTLGNLTAPGQLAMILNDVLGQNVYIPLSFLV